MRNSQAGGRPDVQGVWRGRSACLGVPGACARPTGSVADRPEERAPAAVDQLLTRRGGRCALEHGCLPALRSGRSAYDYIHLQFNRKPVAARVNHISQFVTIQEDARACVVSAHAGQPAELHAVVLRLLSEGRPAANFVAGPADHVGQGPVADRIEGYCLTLGAQKVQAMVSFYSKPGEPRLMVVLMKVADGPCAPVIPPRLADRRPLCPSGPSRPDLQPAATVRTDVVELGLGAVRAEGALVAADPCRGRIRRQVFPQSSQFGFI